MFWAPLQTHALKETRQHYHRNLLKGEGNTLLPPLPWRSLEVILILFLSSPYH